MTIHSDNGFAPNRFHCAEKKIHDKYYNNNSYELMIISTLNEILLMKSNIFLFNLHTLLSFYSVNLSYAQVKYKHKPIGTTDVIIIVLA